MTDQLRLMRDERTVEKNAFVVMPIGRKTLRDGTTFDFDPVYHDVIAPVLTEAGMNPVRADEIYGQQSLFGPVWRGIQQAEVVIVDFSNRSPNVALEYALSLMIGKRMVYLTQDPDDIPSDVRGRLRYITYSDHYKAMSRMRQELRLQIDAIRLEPATEMALVPLVAGGTDPVPARVVAVAKDFAVVQSADGRRGVLGGADVEYARLVPDLTRRFAEGDQLNGAFGVDINGGMKYTLLADKINPWPRLEAEHPVGSTLTSVVQHVIPTVGAFVPVGHGINGLIPLSTIPGGIVPQPGTEVEVAVVRIDAEQRRIALRLHREHGPSRPPADAADHHYHYRGGPAGAGAAAAVPAIGTRTEGEIVRIKPEGQGGFILVRLPGWDRPAILHCTQMLQPLREDLNSGRVEIGEIVDVEVIASDQHSGRVTVREIEATPEPEVATEIGPSPQVKLTEPLDLREPVAA